MAQEHLSKIEKRERRSPFFIVALIVLALYSFTLLFALYWAFISALKTRIDFISNVFGFPQKWMFKNFSDAFSVLVVPVEHGAGSRDVFLFEMIINSLLIAVVPVIVRVLTTAICSYTLAKYKFKLRNVIYNIIVVVMVLPIVGNLPSQLQLNKAIGFYDKIWSLWLTAGTVWSADFLILYAANRIVPWEFAEAAKIDGAGHFQIFWQIMFPQIRNTVLILMLTGFIASWNDYSPSLIWLPSYPSLAYGLYRFQFSNDQLASSIPIQLAACSISILPIFAIFMVFKDKMIGNLSMGGIKG